MADRYLRIMLTIIAASLVALVAQNAAQTAVAQSGLCGGARNACWVQSAPSAPVYVTSNPKEGMYVTNLPFQPIEVKVAR